MGAPGYAGHARRGNVKMRPMENAPAIAPSSSKLPKHGINPVLAGAGASLDRRYRYCTAISVIFMGGKLEVPRSIESKRGDIRIHRKEQKCDGGDKLVTLDNMH